MKSTGVIALWLCLVWAAAAQTNPICCRYPVRIFGPQAVVNLPPLFQWWARQPVVAATNDPTPAVDADRPMTAWHRITGTKVAMVGSSWVLTAVVYSSPLVRTNLRLILDHPPDAEEQMFYDLQAQLADARQQIAEARHVYATDTNAESKAEARVKAYRHSSSRVGTTEIIQNSRVEARERHAAGTELSQVQQLEAARDQMAQQLKLIPARDGVYLVDWFALDTGRSQKGVPIYDLGILGGNP